LNAVTHSAAAAGIIRFERQVHRHERDVDIPQRADLRHALGDAREIDPLAAKVKT
jgi:hypothetical protein